MVCISNQPPLCTQMDNVTSQPCRGCKKRFGYVNRKVLEGAMRLLSASSSSSTSKSKRRSPDRPAPPAPAYTPHKLNLLIAFSPLRRRASYKFHSRRRTMTAHYIPSESGPLCIVECGFSHNANSVRRHSHSHSHSNDDIDINIVNRNLEGA